MWLIIVIMVAMLFTFSGNSHAAPSINEKKQGLSDLCMLAAFKAKIGKVILGDPVKAEALSYAFQRACRNDLIDLTPTASYLELLDLLRHLMPAFVRR